tara:strand:- start:780 stop:1685 length:906 start_codon:yes stop_codon:yes gene_type:complete
MSKAAELAALIGSQTALSNRNLVINGNMEVAQRGTSHTTAGYGSLDRFQLALSGGTATMSQESFTVGQTDVPGSEKYLRCNVSVGNNNAGVYHMIEAQNVFPAIGGKVTLSYYAKGTSPTDGLNVKVAWYDGSDGANATAQVVTLTSSWVKYTHTFTTPSVSGLNLAPSNTNARLEISWLQKDSDTGTAAFDLNLAQVQLEVGEQATPFEHRSYADELRRCQRYYFEINFDAGEEPLGAYYNSNRSVCTQAFHVQMRTDPTVTSTFGNGGLQADYSNEHCFRWYGNAQQISVTSAKADAEL